ncbi:hypothetical protein DFS34DRAFT_114124 [Phlyctochytrium arcticum]|nr:hypothetical protein DFS34DRAFT_114124 [Phlyctochytrium arcticum]
MLVPKSLSKRSLWLSQKYGSLLKHPVVQFSSCGIARGGQSKNLKSTYLDAGGLKPRSTDSKSTLVEWAQGLGISHDAKDTKPMLWTKIKEHLKGASESFSSPAKKCSSLETAKNKDLIAIAERLGLASGGTKPILHHRILTHLHDIAASPVPQTLTAIDVGAKNAGFVRLSLNIDAKGAHDSPVILDWGVQSLGEMATDVTTLVRSCRSAMDARIYHDPPTDVFLIERQTWRAIHGRLTIQMPILVGRTFEAIISTMVVERTGKEALSIDPRYVAKHFGFAGMGKYLTKKRNATMLVHQFLSNPDASARVTCASKWKDVFDSATKKDDLSDALLMGLAWREWYIEGMRMAKEFNITASNLR